MPVATPASPFLQTVRAAVYEELRPQVELAMKVAVCQAGGLRRAEIAERTGADPAELRAATALLKRAATRFRPEEDPRVDA